MTVFLIILAVFLLILAAVLFLPLTLNITFKDGFFLKLRFSGIKFFEIEPERDEDKPQKKDTISDKTAENKAVTFGKEMFSQLRQKYGALGAVKRLLVLFGDILSHIKRLLRHIKIKKVRLNLTVATDNAAMTAIEYGTVCGLVYPALSFLDTCAGVDFKQINVASDFDSKESQFDFSLTVRLRIFYLLQAALGAFIEYKKFVKEENLYERK